MGTRIGSDRPALNHFLQRQFGFRPPADLCRVRNIIVAFKSFRPKTPEIGGLASVGLITDDDVMLDKDWHVFRRLAGRTSALFPFALVLLPGFWIGDQPVRVLPGQAHGFSAIGGGQERNRLWQRIKQTSIYLIVLTVVVHVLAGP
jgi:hypothetical protein